MEEDKFYNLVETYRNPDHFGRPEKFSYSADSYSPSCGDKFSLYIDVNNGIITDASFYGSGCVISTVSMSKLCGFLIGKKPEEIKDLNFESIKKLIGLSEISVSRIKCATIGLDAIREIHSKINGK